MLVPALSLPHAHDTAQGLFSLGFWGKRDATLVFAFILVYFCLSGSFLYSVFGMNFESLVFVRVFGQVFKRLVFVRVFGQVF